MLQQLAAARHAQLATIRPDGRPHVVPITFALDGGQIVTAIDQKPKTTTRVQRLANILVHPAVSVLADHYEDDWQALWWIRADGSAAILEEGRRYAQALTALQRRYPSYLEDPPRGPAIIIDIRGVTGWSARGTTWTDSSTG